MVASRYPNEDTDTCAPREARAVWVGRLERTDELGDIGLFQLVAMGVEEIGARGRDILVSLRMQAHEERPGAMSRMVPSGDVVDGEENME
jgi:hypothetical protein